MEFTLTLVVLFGLGATVLLEEIRFSALLISGRHNGLDRTFGWGTKPTGPGRVTLPGGEPIHTTQPGGGTVSEASSGFYPNSIFGPPQNATFGKDGVRSLVGASEWGESDFLWPDPRIFLPLRPFASATWNSKGGQLRLGRGCTSGDVSSEG